MEYDGFGDTYWEVAITKRLISWCENEGIEIEINPELIDLDLSGRFSYHDKETLKEVNALIDSYNQEAAKSKFNLVDGYEEIEYMERKTEKEPLIELRENSTKMLYTFIHEIGHYLLYKRKIRQTEKGANHYIAELFKGFPKWLSYQFYQAVHIACEFEADVKHTFNYLELDINKKNEYFKDNAEHKLLHQRGEWAF